jgi:hypothetical protein
LGHRDYRIGYAQLSGDQPFAQKVTQGLVEAAVNSHVELLVTDNRDSAEKALKNAVWPISQRVDFVIKYEFHYRVGPILPNMFHKARISTMALDIPMPNAIYFGVNNYAAGIVGGDAQGWGPEDGLKDEIAKPHSPFIGAVAYIPEKYGGKILPIVLRCLNGQAVPPPSISSMSSSPGMRFCPDAPGNSQPTPLWLRDLRRIEEPGGGAVVMAISSVRSNFVDVGRCGV